jgi:plastocyanin
MRTFAIAILVVLAGCDDGSSSTPADMAVAADLSMNAADLATTSGDMATASGDMAIAQADLAVAMLNGCDPTTAMDLTGMASVTINFPVAGLKYSPACIKVTAGTKVTFMGDFSSHPLAGGADGTLDANSPITRTSSGVTATYTIANAGSYGYYCEFHVASGMQGAIFAK